MATQRPSSSTSEVSKKRKRDHSSSPHWKHEVFLSFYGNDTRRGFTDHLYADLKRKGILVFRDDETLKQGEYISKALRKAIKKSQYVIVILSANYASSKWCLMELAKIVEWEEKRKLITIIPIFYHVDPSDVRNQRGPFAEAFAAHEKDPKVDIKKIEMWRNAFRKVGNIVGEHIHDRYESTIIQKVCGRISNELNSRFSRHHDYDKLVAIDSHVDKMMELLDMESNDVRFVGIHGMGGVGKTTLAEIIYDRVSNSNSNYRFEGSSFISCIREKSTTVRDLASLQKELLSTIMQEEIHVWDHHQGIRMILKMLQNKMVFIVLDDVDSDEQLKVLAGDRKWFGPGSRVIITCRDSHLLRTHEVNDIYNVELLKTTEALQLFSLSAFKQTHPTENYKALSMDFVNYAHGLPLALKVLGSFLFGRTIDAWKSARDQLEANPNKEIMDVLQISFDGLKYSQKELFFDMACFFRGQDIFFGMLLERFGHYRIDLDVLVEKSLISKSKYGWLSMHDLLKELGREIVRRECPEEPGRRSRLHRLEDFYHVLKNDTGTDATKGIVVDFRPETKERLNAKAFSKMRKLRYLKLPDFQTLKWRGDPLKYMPTNELRYLQLPGYHSKSLPSSFQPKNLTILTMSGSRMKQLWMGSMVLPNLKLLILNDSKNFIETPDLTGAPNLEVINLSGCTSLCEVHPSIGSLKKLKTLFLDYCSSLEKLPDMSSLECLTNLLASGTAITQILPSSFQLENLKALRMSGSRMKQLWKGLMVLPNLKELDLRDSKNLIETPDLTGAPNLERIDLLGCKSLSEVHPSIGSLKKLKSLALNGCSSLEKLPDLSSLECLTHLEALGTAITQILPSSFQPENLTILTMSDSRMKQLWKGLMVLPNLKKLHLTNFENLIETPDLAGVPNLEELNLSGCRSLCEVHPSIVSLKKLKSLLLSHCSSLEKLPDLSSLECLTHRKASGTAITQILPSSFLPENLTILTMSGSRMKQRWKGLMVLPNLKEFDLSYSVNLIETPDLTGAPNLERINLSGCRSLCEVHPSIGSLKKLKLLLLNDCSSLEKLPDLSSLECLTHLGASKTAITQIPSVNLRPKSIGDGVSFCFEGRKLMRLKSRDPIYDIGSLVKYQKEGTYDRIEAAWIDFDNKGENILDMAGVVISALDDDLNMISGWPLGFPMIPNWVQYKSKGSSVKIDLDANMNPEMGCAFFIVCDYDKFLISKSHFGRYTSISFMFEHWRIIGSGVRLTIVFETDEEYYVEYDCSGIPPLLNVSFSKRMGFWIYVPAVLRFLDIRRVIKISFKTRGLVKEVEVKECGVHLVYTDDANSDFFNSIAPRVRSEFPNSDFDRHFDACMKKHKGKKKKEKRKRQLRRVAAVK